MQSRKLIIWTAKIVSLFLIILTSSCSQADDPQGRDEIGKSTSELVRLRKFEAQTYNLTVSPGVTIQLVRIINPMLRNGCNWKNRPVLFIHGIIASASHFIVNSIDARPNDWSNLNVSQLSSADLNLLAKDPSSNSLPFLLSNMCHDVWLVNRRATVAAQLASAISIVDNSASFGVLQSIVNSVYELLPSLPSWQANETNHTTNYVIDGITNIIGNLLNYTISVNVNSSTATNNNVPTDKGLFNNYWNFSLDEQAANDMPKMIDFILSQNANAKQVSTVSHSTGGAIMLMALADKPEYADKIGKVVLWAPAMDLGRTKDNNALIETAIRLEPILRNYDGPLGFGLLDGLTEIAVLGFCQTGQIKGESCDSMTDAFDGIGSDQLNSQTGFTLAGSDVTGAHELAQLLQSIIKGKMHQFDFGQLRNYQVYGKSQVDLYNLKKINEFTQLSIWQGNTDALVTTADTQILIADLDFPVDYRYINGTGLKFDHNAFMLHVNVSILVNIPTLIYLEQH